MVKKLVGAISTSTAPLMNSLVLDWALRSQSEIYGFQYKETE